VRGRRDRSRSPARDIKRGRFRDLSPSHNNLCSRDGLHGLPGSNASHQTEDKGGWHHFCNQTFKGDRYIHSPEPNHSTRRSPAPSPGCELTPPRPLAVASRNTPLARPTQPVPQPPSRPVHRVPEQCSVREHQPSTWRLERFRGRSLSGHEKFLFCSGSHHNFSKASGKAQTI